MKALDIVREAGRDRFTGALLRVERRGRVVLEAAFGTLDDSAQAPRVELTTAFDLASLTKLFTSSAALGAVAQGRLQLDAPLLDVLPEWRNRAQAPITLRMLLAHTSGMQSGADYRGLLAHNVEDFALTQPLVATPGQRVVYSDLGYIVLGLVLARAYQSSLASVIDRACAIVGVRDTRYRPRGRDAEAVPATELDAWRGRVRGAVHDEKACLMGGVAGHAGLFGTARDVAALAEAYLGPLCGRSPGPLPPSLTRAAVEQQGWDQTLRRGLGWALKTSDENSCGALTSRRTFGHTGFTGTCVWVDPERDLSIVFLTNALYYGRRDLREVRAAVCDAVVAEFEQCARSA